MKHLKKILAVALVAMSIMAISLPAMAEWGITITSHKLYTNETKKYNYGDVMAGTYLLLGRSSADGTMNYVAIRAEDRDRGTNAKLTGYVGWMPYYNINCG